MMQFFTLIVVTLAVVASGVLVYFVVSLFASNRLASFAGLLLATVFFAPRVYGDPSFMNLASISIGLLVLWWHLFLRNKLVAERRDQ